MAALLPGEVSLIAPATMRALSYSSFWARHMPRVSMAEMFFGSILSALEAYPAAALVFPATRMA